MASLSVVKASGARTGVLLSTCVAENGSVAHPWFRSGNLADDDPDSIRNLADAVHFLSALHGRYPGVIDHSTGRALEPTARNWLTAAGEAMATERFYLARLAVAVGPVPRTPGGSGSQAAVVHQRSALATLSQSERQGCALGAALAFALDWLRIRNRLDEASLRLGIEAPHCRLGTRVEIEAVADDAGISSAIERAMLFGGQQLALQHRGLWDLLESRASARAGA